MAEQLISIGNVEESDALGFTLHQAAIQGNKKALKRVLDKGIHVDYPNNEGQSPLFCACFVSHEGVVDYLLSAGANPNEKSNSGLTPVIVAGFSGNVKILIKLLNEGGDLRLHDNHGRNVKDWAMLQPTPKKRMKMLEFLDKARLFAMSSSGQDLLMKKAPSNILHKAHHRQNTITKMFTSRIGRHSVHDKFEKMATSQHSVGFGQVYGNGSEETGFLSSVPLVSESNLRHDPHGETYNNGAFAVMESMWWDYTEITIKRLHRDIDPFQGGVVDLLINEIEHIGKLRHPHVLTLMGVCQTNNLEGLVLIYERIGQGSLYNSLHQKNERLPSETIQAIAVQMCNAIVFIHLRGLVHCAITSHAISVVNANTFKLGNFEYMVESSKCELGKKNAVATNTNENCVYNWLAPEVIFNLPPSFYCDMYSYCVVLWELFHGDIPWDSQSSEAIRSQYSKGNNLRVYGKVAEYFKVIMEYGLELDPNKRKLSFLHVRDLLLAAPKDAQYYLKTHFQHLNQADNKTENSSIAKLGYIIKPSAPQAEPNTEVKRTPEYSNTSRTVDQGLREKHERRRQKEKERAKRLDDSDNEQAYRAERQKTRTKTEDRKYEQRDYKTETRQVTGQNVDDLNNNCSEPQNYCRNIIRENLDHSPRKAAKPKLFKTEGLDWEIFPKEAGEEFLYTVQVTRQPSPAKPPSSPLKTSPVKTSPMKRRPEYAEPSLRQPHTPTRKGVLEVTSSEETETSPTETTESSSEPKQFARGRELGKVTSSMGRFSYLSLDNHQQSRSSAAKPACHATGAVLRDEYSTLGKLTTAGSVYALYNDHSPDLPMGQPSHREPPDYATLRRRLLEMKQPSAPHSVRPEKNWFSGRGSVRDLAQLFQQQIQEHDFYQAILGGKLSNDKDGGDTPAKTGPGKFSDYGNHAKCRLPPGIDKADKDSFGSLSTVTMSDGELTGEPEGKPNTSTSTESDLVSQWVDHEIRKIKRHLSKPLVYDDSQIKEVAKQDGRTKQKSPDVFGTYHEPSTACSADVEDSSTSHDPSGGDQHYETGDHLKEPESSEDFYFDDELYAKRGKKSTRIYYDSETSAPSVISESPQTSSLPMDTVLKSNSMSSVEDRVDTTTEKQSGNRKKLSRIPTSRSKLAPKTKSPDEVYSNIVTVRSSLDGSGLHQVTHKMKNLKTGGTKTLVNDTVSAQKVTTKVRAAN